MSRVRLRWGTALVGLLVVLAELGFGVYALIWTYRWTHDPLIFPAHIPIVRLYLPASLLALASVLGAIALYRTIRGLSGWGYYAFALAPVAGFLALYQPPMNLGQMAHAIYSTLPWVPPGFWSEQGNQALSIGLQIVPYLAVAAWVLGLVLDIQRGGAGRQQGAPLSLLPDL